MRSFPFRTRDGRDALVREALARDARACLDIAAEASRDRPRTISVLEDEVWTLREWRSRRVGWTDSGVWLVAEVDGRVAGLLTAARGARVVDRHAADFGITVGSPFRGIGVGRALIETLEVWARERGIGRISLGVFPDNDRARSLYRSLGYEEEGIERHAVRFPEGDTSIVRMSKIIDACPPASPRAQAGHYDEMHP